MTKRGPSTSKRKLRTNRHNIRILPHRGHHKNRSHTLLTTRRTFRHNTRYSLNLTSTSIATRRPIRQPQLLRVILSIHHTNRLIKHFLVNGTLFGVALPNIINKRNMTIHLLTTNMRLSRLLHRLLHHDLSLLTNLNPVTTTRTTRLRIITITQHDMTKRGIRLNSKRMRRILFIMFSTRVILYSTLRNRPLSTHMPPSTIILISSRVARQSFTRTIRHILVTLFLLLYTTRTRNTNHGRNMFHGQRTTPNKGLPQRSLRRPNTQPHHHIYHSIRPFNTRINNRAYHHAKHTNRSHSHHTTTTGQLSILRRHRSLTTPNKRHINKYISSNFRQRVKRNTNGILNTRHTIHNTLHPRPTTLNMRLVRPYHRRTILRRNKGLLTPTRHNNTLNLPRKNQLLRGRRQVIGMIWGHHELKVTRHRVFIRISKRHTTIRLYRIHDNTNLRHHTPPTTNLFSVKTGLLHYVNKLARRCLPHKKSMSFFSQLITTLNHRVRNIRHISLVTPRLRTNKLLRIKHMSIHGITTSQGLAQTIRLITPHVTYTMRGHNRLNTNRYITKTRTTNIHTRVHP